MGNLSGGCDKLLHTSRSGNKSLLLNDSKVLKINTLRCYDDSAVWYGDCNVSGGFGTLRNE